MTLQITSTPPSPAKLHFRPFGRHKRPNLGLTTDLVCALGEFLGTGMFLFLALGGSDFAGHPFSSYTDGSHPQ